MAKMFGMKQNTIVALLALVLIAGGAYFIFGDQLGATGIVVPTGDTSCPVLSPKWGTINCKYADAYSDPKSTENLQYVVSTYRSGYSCGTYLAPVPQFCEPWSIEQNNTFMTSVANERSNKAYKLTCQAAECKLTGSLTSLFGVDGDQQIRTYLSDNYMAGTYVDGRPAACVVQTKPNGLKLLYGTEIKSSSGTSVSAGHTFKQGDYVTVYPAVYGVVTNQRISLVDPSCSYSNKALAEIGIFVTKVKLSYTERASYWQLYSQDVAGYLDLQQQWGVAGCVAPTRDVNGNLCSPTNQCTDVEYISSAQTSSYNALVNTLSGLLTKAPSTTTLEYTAYTYPVGTQLTFLDGFRTLVGPEIRYKDGKPIVVDLLTHKYYQTANINYGDGCFAVPTGTGTSFQCFSNAECNAYPATPYCNTYTLTCVANKPCNSDIDCVSGVPACMSKQLTTTWCDSTVKTSDQYVGTCKNSTRSVACCSASDCPTGQDCHDNQCITVAPIRVEAPYSYECVQDGDLRYLPRSCDKYPGTACMDYLCVKSCGTNEYWDQLTHTCKVKACPTGTVMIGEICCEDKDSDGQCDAGGRIACADETEANSCSTNKPQYCSAQGVLVPQCSTCGCPEGQVCAQSGMCTTEDKKDDTKTDNTIYYLIGGVIVVAGAAYFLTQGGKKIGGKRRR